MEGIFIYAERSLREAVRARAYKQRRTMSDIGRDALYAAVTEPVEIVRETWYGEVTHYVIGRVRDKWVFAWAPQRIERVWAEDVADAASDSTMGVTWWNTEDGARASARACLESQLESDDDEEWYSVARTLGIELEKLESNEEK